MKKIRLLAAAAMTALGVCEAVAADLPMRKEPPLLPPPPPPAWTGFYAGVNIGGGWRDAPSDNAPWWLWNGARATPAATVSPVTASATCGNCGGPTPPPPPPTPPAGAPFFVVANNNNAGGSGGVVGGGQIGYNFQFGPSFLVGVETDFQGTSLGSGGGSWRGANLLWFGTARGRLGYLVMPTLLLYGTGGFAYGEVQTAGWWNRFNSVGTGWTAGGGGEWMFMPNWSVKVEYLYTELSDFHQDNGWGWNGAWGWDGGRRDYRFHTVRAGLNWHFNFAGAPAPILF